MDYREESPVMQKTSPSPEQMIDAIVKDLLYHDADTQREVLKEIRNRILDEYSRKIDESQQKADNLRARRDVFKGEPVHKSVSIDTLIGD